MSVQPRSASSRQQCSSEPPVASIGSSTSTGRPARSAGQRLHVGARLERLLVAGQPDEAHRRLGQQGQRGVGHAEPGPQHRHEQRRVGQPGALGRARPASRSGTARPAKERAASYTSMVVSSCSAARNDAGVGAGVAHRGEPRLGERMINDEYVHGVQPTGRHPRSDCRLALRRLARHDGDSDVGACAGRRPAPTCETLARLLPARAARCRPGRRRAAGGDAGHPVDQDDRQGVGDRPGDPHGRPDHAGGRGHPGQGAGAVRQGPPARPGRPDLPVGRRGLRLPVDGPGRRRGAGAAPASTWPAWPPRSRPARRRWRSSSPTPGPRSRPAPTRSTW